jgi:L-asparagine transporter-like permease
VVFLGGRLPQLKNIMAKRRNKIVLALGFAGVSLIGLLLLTTQLVLGFPVENNFRQLVFTYRTSWLSLALILNLVTLLASLLIFRQERQANERI